MTVLLFSLQLVLGILVPWWILRRDLDRLRPEQLARAWNDVTFWMAIVVFGPLALPFHFTKTRRSLLGLLLGLGWFVAAVLAISLLSLALGWVLGV